MTDWSTPHRIQASGVFRVYETKGIKAQGIFPDLRLEYSSLLCWTAESLGAFET
jgi:hypothetical protein